MIDAIVTGAVSAVLSAVTSVAVMRVEIRFLKHALSELSKRVEEIDRHLRPYRFPVRPTSES